MAQTSGLTITTAAHETRELKLTPQQATALRHKGLDLTPTRGGGAVLAVNLDQLSKVADLGARYDLRHRTDLFDGVTETFISWLCEVNPYM